MTREETQKLLAIISAIYPNFKVQDKSATVEAWHLMLSEYSYQDMSIALKIFVNTSGKGFAPSVDQLIAMTRKPSELTQMSEGEAWALVNKAIGRSLYYAEEEFAKLPQEVQRAVGSAEQLRTWAVSTDYNGSVVSSNFMRAYRTVCERKQMVESLPAEVRDKLLTKARDSIETEKEIGNDKG